MRKSLEPVVLDVNSVFIDEYELLKRIPISRRTLFNWRDEGKIPFVRPQEGRRIIYHWPSVEKALLRLQTQPVE